MFPEQQISKFELCARAAFSRCRSVEELLKVCPQASSEVSPQTA